MAGRAQTILMSEAALNNCPPAASAASGANKWPEAPLVGVEWPAVAAPGRLARAGRPADSQTGGQTDRSARRWLPLGARSPGPLAIM